jgi:hypothetical protein
VSEFGATNERPRLPLAVPATSKRGRQRQSELFAVFMVAHSVFPYVGAKAMERFATHMALHPFAYVRQNTLAAKWSQPPFV